MFYECFIYEKKHCFTIVFILIYITADRDKDFSGRYEIKNVAVFKLQPLYFHYFHFVPKQVMNFIFHLT